MCYLKGCTRQGIPISMVRPEIWDEYWEEMKKEQPALLVFTRQMDEKAAKFIEDSDYRPQ